MKNLLKILSILILSTLMLTACSKDDDPADNNLFIGTYNGTLTYTGDGDNKSTNDGKVTVTKVGNTYNFAFSDGIPNINGIEMEKGDNSVVSVGGDAAKYIKITSSKLTIAYTTDGKIWSANCTR